MRFTATRLIVIALIALVAAGCGGRRSINTMTSHELFAEGKKAYDKKKYLRAIELFQAGVYNFPGETNVDTAQYYLALAYFGNEEYEVAQVEFNRVVLNYPSSVYFENAVFMRAVSFFEVTPKHYALDQTELETAIKQFEDFIIDFPESEAVEDATKYLQAARTRMARKTYEGGMVYNHIGAYHAAKVYFQKVIDEYTDTEYCARASFQYANMEYRLKRFEEARKKFEDFLTVFPDHEWAQKAHKMAVKAAFRSGEEAYKKEDYLIAREKLELFIRDFPNSDLTRKADKYLKKIAEASAENSRVENAGS